MEIRFSNNFRKQRRKAPGKIKLAFNKRLHIFLKEPFHPQLRNHLLTGKFSGLRSINITGDWRAIYKEDDDKIVFILLGTHSQLYK